MPTTWSTTDKTSGVTLSGGNLVATMSGFTPGVRSIDRLRTGKYYWECTGTTWAAAQTWIGVATARVSLSAIATSTDGCTVGHAGTIFVGQTNSGATLGTRASGDIIGIALDCDTQLIWFRVAPSGNWNGNAAYAPGGSGGISLASMATMALYALCGSFTSSGDIITANFGASAFSGTVPVGYTSGFPSPNVPPLQAVATQLGVEHWGPGDPVAQVTQTALEVWGGITAGARSALVSQIAVEEWGVIPITAPTARQYAVTVNSS